MKTLVTTIFILILLFMAHSAIGQHGVDEAWSDNVELPLPPASSSVRGFLYSNMGVFSNNKRIVFMNKEDGAGGVWHTHSYDGTNWTFPQLFGPDSLVIGFNSPKAIVDHNDTLHVIWAGQSPKALYYSKLDSALNIIIDSVRISDNPEYSSFSDMYISSDRQGRIHVMWNEGKTGTSDKPESFYSQTSDGGNTWLPKIMLSVDDDIASSFPRGQFNAYEGDSLAIFWRDSSTVFSPSENWNLQMAVSKDGGLSWDPPVEINASIAMQGDPDLVIDPYGGWHLFYHEASAADPYWGMRLVYGFSDDLGATWTPSDFSDTISYAQRSYLAEGSRYDVNNDVLWTFWKEEDIVGLQGGDMMAAYSLNQGESWSEPQYVTDRNDTTIGFKAVDLMPDGGIAVNYELPNYPSAGLLRLFYKERGPVVVAQLIENYNPQKAFIFPNPFLAEITIQHEGESDYQLHDYQGRIIREGTLVDELKVDLSELESAAYILKVGEESFKLIKN